MSSPTLSRIQSLDDDDTWSLASAPVPTAPLAAAEPLDLVLQELIPGKPADKRAAWLTILNEAEFDTLEDLKVLSAADWARLNLPLAVSAALRRAVSTAAAPVPAPAPQAPQAPLTQLDCIVLDVSASMKARSKIDVDKTREDVSKLVFHTLVDKLMGLELNHAVGLIGFGERVTTLPVTREYERFHDELGRLDANQNGTALYDAIEAAVKHLCDYEATYATGGTSLPKRVFVLTDGEDNRSTLRPWEVARTLQSKGIVVDALPVAGANQALRGLCAASNGLCLEVENEEQCVGLFEREALLHLPLREYADPPAPVSNPRDFDSLAPAAVVRSVATAKPKPLSGSVLTQSAASALASDVSGAVPSAPKGVGAGATKRILKEYRDIAKVFADLRGHVDGVDGWSVYADAKDITQWRAVLHGPKGSPYEGGCWLLTISFPADYPFSAPRARFITPIYHCNISADGRICLDILKDGWSPALSAGKLLQSIAALLADPNPDDPLDTFKGQLARDDRAAYNVAARAATRDHAMTPLAELEKQNGLA